jgi:hypothetical protein
VTLSRWVRAVGSGRAAWAGLVTDRLHVPGGQEPRLCGCAPVTQICAPGWRSAGCLPVRDHAAMLLPPSRAAARSGRAREVVALITEAMSSAGIAQRIVLSPLTVTTHAGHA